jgi:DeoR/GlpR family transcriptional regulator of sugar metabolism
MYEIRQAKIKDLIQKNQIVSMKELQELCPDVSLMTLHRDLDALAAAGIIVKLRGGARVAMQSGETSFQIRQNENMNRKRIIAAKAINLINEGGSVFFDAGTTTLSVIREMPDINLTIVTSGANFAYELQRFSNITAYMCCGALNRSNMALSGNSTLNFLKDINIDLGFIGVSGYSDEYGFTCGKESEMLVKKLVIQKARKSVVLMDATKINKLMPYTFAKLEDVDYVICDVSLPECFIENATKCGTRVL